MQGFVNFVLFAFLLFVGFSIYFIFKILQFVIQATNLYKDIIQREDTIIKLLKDIRDGQETTDSQKSRNTQARPTAPGNDKTASARPAAGKQSKSLKTPCETCGNTMPFEELDMYNGKYICTACLKKLQH